jgi:hypothetical protein
MAILTIVRSLIGETITLPGDVNIRPWSFVEMRDLTAEQKTEIRKLMAARRVQVSQLVDGAPLSTVNLEAKS